ncbi:acyl-CoA N-acyltransferase [Dipodascopsis uninucleata]
MTIRYRPYTKPSPLGHEDDLLSIRNLISQDLSEPYGIYVYRYFIYQWPELCFLAIDDSKSSSGSFGDTETDLKTESVIGVVVGKLAPHRDIKLRGYIAMLAVATEYRGRGIAKELVKHVLDKLVELDADEVVLETETSNKAAIALYENFGFVRSKSMHRYYINSNDAFRFVLPLKVVATLRYCALKQMESQESEGHIAEVL